MDKNESVRSMDFHFVFFFFWPSAYLTSKTNRSDRLQFSGACGAIGAASADIRADSGAHFASATSKMQSHSAMTKFNLANVSLCVRSSSVSTGKSGALKVHGTFHIPVAHWNVWSAKASLAKCLEISPEMKPCQLDHAFLFGSQKRKRMARQWDATRSIYLAVIAA